MRARTSLILLACAAFAACANPDKRTLAELRGVEPDTTDILVDEGLDEAIAGYRSFLDEAPESELTPEAMRRLADLKLEREFGYVGYRGDSVETRSAGLAAPRSAGAPVEPEVEPGRDADASGPLWGAADDEAREASVAEASEMWITAEVPVPLPAGEVDAAGGPREAIALYDRILATYPNYEHNDRVLYQKARAFDELGEPDRAIAVTAELIARYPHSRNIDEAQFRRGEYFFVRRRWLDAEEAYGAVVNLGAHSDFYEHALYKLGWTFYKQELNEEALHQYVALLDHKVATGYDFDQAQDEDASRRVADTFRVVSLSFSDIGGAEAVTAYFAQRGARSYEDRVYRHLGEFYFDKRRYQDAASAYETFVALHPMHRSAPHFGMRVVAIYEEGGFPQLVLGAKQEFAERYALGAAYWNHFPLADSGEVVAYLNANLRDLATHFHAAYQDPEKAEAAEENFGEAERWYRTFLASFPGDAETPEAHHRLADLLLEHEDFAVAAREFERTAYDYEAYEQASEAGYAAIFAHRREQERVDAAPRLKDSVREIAVASTLRFVDVFGDHEHAAKVLGAAVSDLYAMERFDGAIEHGHRLLSDYPDADGDVIRAAWLAIAHASFGLEDYVQAEGAYGQVLERTPPEHDEREAVVDNLAASIYKQGEAASAEGDHRTAAEHYLRVGQAASESAIAATSEYDASASLIALEDWDGAVEVLDRFRERHPDHELQGAATRKLASVYRTQGAFEDAAVEYERVAREAPEDEVRREAWLTAGELYEEASLAQRAIEAYGAYIERYPAPLELAIETRFKVAELHETLGAATAREAALREIVGIDRAAGEARTDRIRYLAARSALELTQPHFNEFDAVRLVQPFDRSLARKKALMDKALRSFRELVTYEVGEVTAAATFYVAEIYRGFSASLLTSERPGGLSKAELLDYELVLEEEAYPFEEKAIEVHRKNLELIDAGIFNRWVEASLTQLGELVPGRYAKAEASSGVLTAPDRYVFVSPRAEGLPASDVASVLPVAEAKPAPETQLEVVHEPAAENGGELEAAEPTEPVTAPVAAPRPAPASITAEEMNG